MHFVDVCQIFVLTKNLADLLNETRYTVVLVLLNPKQSSITLFAYHFSLGAVVSQMTMHFLSTFVQLLTTTVQNALKVCFLANLYVIKGPCVGKILQTAINLALEAVFLELVAKVTVERPIRAFLFAFGAYLLYGSPLIDAFAAGQYFAAGVVALFCIPTHVLTNQANELVSHLLLGNLVRS